MPLSWNFMQDNASTYTSYVLMTFFQRIMAHLIPWPSLSPNLNPIANFYKFLEMAPYADYPLFSIAEELK